MTLSTIIDSIKNLSPTPQILPKLKSLLQDPNSSVNEILSLIKVDAALSAQIVRVSNSAFYGAANPSRNIEEAVQRIGFNEVYKLVAFVASSHVLGAKNSVYKLDRNALWEESITCGTIMQIMAQTVGEDSDTAYTIGLLHAIGKVVINSYCNKESIAFEQETPTPENELTVLGFSYADAGAELLKKWKFQKDIITPIDDQLEPAKAADFKQLAALLYLAKASVPHIDLKPGELVSAIQHDDQILSQAEVDNETIVCCVMAAKASLHDIHDLIAAI